MKTCPLVIGLILLAGRLVSVAQGQAEPEAFSAASALQATVAAELTPTDAPSPAGPIEEITAEELPLGEPIPQEEPLADMPADGVEMVQERYPNRNIKVERQVVQDHEENYVNHGSWKMYDPEGNLIATGQYSQNQRVGAWSRWYRPDEAKLFSKAPFDQFEPPFLSQTTFQADLMEGAWTILDSKKLKICEWNFVSGRRHGKSTWWYANGQRMRELNYEDGELNGEMLEWQPDGTLVTRDRYDQGRRIHKVVTNHANGQKKSEGTYLDKKIQVKTLDDWWQATEPTYVSFGKQEKHGPWTSWFENGQKKVEGNYDHDQPDGEFNWWHTNGQKAVQAAYARGKQEGPWIWWHDNGLKAISGMYVEGKPSGRWVWWEESGKVAQRVDFSAEGNQAMENQIPQPSLDSGTASEESDRSAQRGAGGERPVSTVR